jgi:5-deoxy-glucuronate isomerase
MKGRADSDLLVRWNGTYGLTRIIEIHNETLPSIGFSLLRSEKGNTYNSSSGPTEICLVVLSGRWKIKVSGDEREYVCERSSVFDEKAYAFYLPPDIGYELTAEKEGEMAFCESNGSKRGTPLFITPSDIKQRTLGGDPFQRTAFDILDETREANSLRVGETISKPGHWSSYPPHKHDTDNMPHETALEELYFFLFKPEEGFGFQRIYTDDRSLNEVLLIEDRSIVLIPSGYHPVVASPGYSLYYLWILAGEKRSLRSYFDPRYEWLNPDVD